MHIATTTQWLEPQLGAEEEEDQAGEEEVLGVEDTVVEVADSGEDEGGTVDLDGVDSDFAADFLPQGSHSHGGTYTPDTIDLGHKCSV